MRRPRLLLLSAYRSDSHAAWVDVLSSELTDFDWQVLELPGVAQKLRRTQLAVLVSIHAGEPPGRVHRRLRPRPRRLQLLQDRLLGCYPTRPARPADLQ